MGVHCVLKTHAPHSTPPDTHTHTHTHTPVHTHLCTQFAFATQHSEQAFASTMEYSKARSPCLITYPLCLVSKFQIRSVHTYLSRRRWDVNIETDLQEVGFRVMDWIELAMDRDWWRALVNAVMNRRAP